VGGVGLSTTWCKVTKGKGDSLFWGKRRFGRAEEKREEKGGPVRIIRKRDAKVIRWNLTGRGRRRGGLAAGRTRGEGNNNTFR